MMSLSEALSQYKHSRQETGLWRWRTSLQRLKLNFCSNDYLSLSHHADIKEAYRQGYSSYPSGSGASMVLGGYQEAHQQLERAFADFLGAEDALLFSSGYAANLAVMGLMHQLQASVLIHKYCHASMYDGLKLYQLPFQRYKSLDDSLLDRLESGIVWMTEGIFSMEGQLSPLDQIYDRCQQQGIPLIVDEAHSFGVLGREGRGACDHFNLPLDALPLRIIPLGKAMAGQGAVVVGQRLWIEALLNLGRSYIYSTGMSPALAYGLKMSLDYVKKAEDARTKLQSLVQYFQQKIGASSYQWAESSTAIQQLRLGCPFKAQAVQDSLLKQGIYCGAIRQPTVPPKAAGLRVTLNAGHSKEDIDCLMNELGAILS